MTADAIDHMPRLAVAATGTDPVDVKACAERGVVVSNIRNYAVNTVPEHTFQEHDRLLRIGGVTTGPLRGGAGTAQGVLLLSS